jgi:hypothetical protein
LTIKEINDIHPNFLTHHSTWMLFKNTNISLELVEKLKNISGEKVMIIQLKIRVFGDEAEIKVYNNIKLSLLLKKIENMTGLPSE